MSLMLFGLLCLCFVSFGGTEKLRGGRTATRKLSEENEAIHVLFSMIDGQILLDNTITASELKKAWQKHDKNGNEVLSEYELRVALEDSELGYTKEAEFLFGYMGLIDEEIENWLKRFDKDHDGTVTESDLVNEYNHYLEILTKPASMPMPKM